MQDLEFLRFTDEADLGEIVLEGGHEGVAFGVGVQLGDEEVGAAGEELRVDLAAADDVNGDAERGRVEGSQVADHFHAVDLGGAGDDERFAAG